MTFQCGFCGKSHSKQWSETAIFVTSYNRPLGQSRAFRSNWVYHYVYFRFYEAGLGLTSTWLVLRLPALYVYEAKTTFTDVIFLNIRHWNGKMTRQEYKEPYLYIFKMTDKTGSSNRSSSTAHSHGHRLMQQLVQCCGLSSWWGGLWTFRNSGGA